MGTYPVIKSVFVEEEEKIHRRKGRRHYHLYNPLQRAKMEFRKNLPVNHLFIYLL